MGLCESFEREKFNLAAAVNVGRLNVDVIISKLRSFELQTKTPKKGCERECRLRNAVERRRDGHCGMT